jgi:integrase
VPRTYLNDTSVRALKAEQQTDFWCSKTPSFGVRVGPRSKTFIAKVRNRRITIGQYPVMSLQEARNKALVLKGSATARQAPETTLRDAIHMFLAHHCKSYRPRSLAEITRLLKKLAPLESRKLPTIATQDVHAIIDELPDSEANHLFKAARTFFRFCVRRRLGPNPLDGLSIPNKERSRARVLSDHEIKSLWNATNEPTHFNRIVRLLLLTGQRRGEIAALRKEWVCANVVTLPASLTKNGRPHSFPIASLSNSVISSAATRNEGLIFPSLSKKASTPFNGWSKSKSALDKKCLISGWTLHDLRRTFASNLAALGVRLEVIERLLNHLSGSFGGVAGIYNRYDFMSEMRVAIELWEAKLKTILGQPA